MSQSSLRPLLRVGFTGSRTEPSDFQKENIREMLFRLRERGTDEFPEFHHGDCIGSDAFFAQVAKEEGYHVISHPPVDETRRAFGVADESCPAKPFLDRNRDIVDETDVLLATPATPRVDYGGTWYTIRYAESLKKFVHISELQKSV